MCYILEYVSWVVASARWTVVPEGSRNPVVILKVIYDLLKIVGNSVSNVQIAFISMTYLGLHSLALVITCFWLIPIFDFGL